MSEEVGRCPECNRCDLKVMKMLNGKEVAYCAACGYKVELKTVTA